MNIPHEPNKWLVVWNKAILLIEGKAGHVTGTRDAFEWFDTRDEAVASIRTVHPDWIDESEEVDETLNGIETLLQFIDYQ